VTQIVLGLAESRWQLNALTIAGLSMAIAVGLWWTYFNRLDDDAVRQLVGKGRIWIYQLWLYDRLPLLISAATVSVGIGHALAVDPQQILAVADRWLLVGSIAAFLLFEAVICFTTIGAGSPHPAFTWGVFYRLVAATVLLGFGWFTGMTPLFGITLAAIAVGAVVLGDVFKEAPASSARN
ncbi:MAG TPA: hypothetical protein DEV81_14360, partial [Cyanobacteria bacterium UBA11049]|nr:hypothetical protein [Cyanobacteria bacterium UBA11049]